MTLKSFGSVILLAMINLAILDMLTGEEIRGPPHPCDEYRENPDKFLNAFGTLSSCLANVLSGGNRHAMVNCLPILHFGTKADGDKTCSDKKSYDAKALQMSQCIKKAEAGFTETEKIKMKNCLENPP